MSADRDRVNAAGEDIAGIIAAVEEVVHDTPGPVEAAMAVEALIACREDWDRRHLALMVAMLAITVTGQEIELGMAISLAQTRNGQGWKPARG